MAYQEIPQSDTDQDSPVKQGLLRQIRDNALELSEISLELPYTFHRRAFDLFTYTISGTFGTANQQDLLEDSGVNIELPSKTVFWPRMTSSLRLTGHYTNTNSPDNPRIRLQDFEGGHNSSAAAQFELECEYISDASPEFGFVNLTDSDLEQDNLVTTDILTGLSELAPSIVHGANSAPKIKRDQIELGSVTVSGTLPGPQYASFISVEHTAFFLNFYSSDAIDLGSAYQDRRPRILPYGPPNDTSDLSTGGVIIQGRVGDPTMTFEVNYKYLIDSNLPGVDYRAISLVETSTNSIIIEDVMLACNYNTEAINRGAPGAPKIRSNALSLSSASVAGTAITAPFTNIELHENSFFPMLHVQDPSEVIDTSFAPNGVRHPFIGVSSTQAATSGAGNFSMSGLWGRPIGTGFPLQYVGYNFNVEYYYLDN